MTLTDGRQRLAKWLLVAALAFSAASAVWFAVEFDWLSLDDVYITLRYARNWDDGLGPVYNPGERVEGYTNFAWMALLAGLMKLGVPGPLAAKALAELCILGAIIFAWLLGRRLGGRDSWAGPATAWALALSSSFTFWGLAGAMEVAPLALTLTAGFYLLLGGENADAKRRNREIIGAGLLFGLSGLLRPEGNLFTLLGVLYVWPGREGRLKRLLIYLLPTAILVGGHEVFRLAYYGDWLPNTFYAKTGLNGRLLLRGLGFMGGFILSHLPLFLLAAALPWRRLGRRLAPMLAAVGLYFIYLVLIGGDWMAWRLLVPVLPILAVTAGLGLDRLRGLNLPLRKAALPVLVAASVGGLCLLSASRGEYAHIGEYRFHETLHFHTGHWLAGVSDPDDTIAVSSAGIIPWLTGLRAIDTLGLNDRHIAREGIDLGGRATPGHERYDNDYLLDRKPDWIIMGLTTIFLLSGEEPAFLPDYDLITRRELWRDYHIVMPLLPTRAILHRRDDIEGLRRMDPLTWTWLWYFTHPLARVVEPLPPPPVYGY
ncbi:MAG TPA: hypothetical protein VM054_11665 [bacterium]|nr:hypothetical protein [bacterium]